MTAFNIEPTKKQRQKKVLNNPLKLNTYDRFAAYDILGSITLWPKPSHCSVPSKKTVDDEMLKLAYLDSIEVPWLRMHQVWPPKLAIGDLE